MDLFLGNIFKFEKDIHYAQQVGVEYTTADSIEEIQKIAQYGNKMKVLWRISIKEKDS